MRSIFNSSAYLILFISLSFSLTETSAQNSLIDSLVEKKVDSIISEGNYTRIPNSDFDRQLDHQVSVKINEKLRFWVTIIGLFITALGGLAVYTFNNKLNQIVKEQAQEQVKLKFESINKDLLGRFVVKNKLEELQKKYRIDRKSELNVMEGKALLREIETQNYQELLPETIDLVGLMNYDRRKASEIDKLIETYGVKFELKETTYMNGAVLHMDDYEYHGNEFSKQQCIYYCDFVSKRRPSYGEPRGVMILLNAIDHYNSKDKEEALEILELTKKIFNDILRGTYGLLASSTVNRIERDYSNPVFGKYIQHLKKELPEEFNLLFQKATLHDEISKKA